MTIDLMHLLEVFGPPILAAVGAVMSAVMGCAIWIAQKAWGVHTARLEAVGSRIVALEDAVADSGEKQRKAIQAMRAELELAKRGAEVLKAGMLSLEGATKAQQATINAYIESMGQMKGKLDAIFRFMDASPRASDSRRG